MSKKLILENLGKEFDGFWAVKNVTAVVLPERITGFVGPNGAGKTTLFHLITGQLKPSRGRIILDNEEITSKNTWEIANLGVGRQFQDVRVFENLTALENVMVALFKNGEDKINWAFKYIFRQRKKLSTYKEKGMELLEFVGLKEKANSLARELSFGQQKLLSFARLLAGNFDLLLLDEPTAGVSPIMIKKIISFLKKLKEEKKKTIILIEHNMNVVSKLADWVYFMHEGEIVFTGRTDHVLGNEEVREIYMGL